jgi:hypothetical protein
MKSSEQFGHEMARQVPFDDEPGNVPKNRLRTDSGVIEIVPPGIELQEATGRCFKPFVRREPAISVAWKIL